MDNNRKEDRLRQLLGRREFLLAAGGALVSLGAFGLEGCGGGSGSLGSAASTSTRSLTLSAAKGKIVLPPGASVKITQVMNLFGKSTPYPDGTFDFGSAAESPLLTTAYGPNGESVLYGFLQQGNTQLSAHSTAIVLAYFVLGVGVHLAEVQSLYRDEITRATSLNALENAVAAAIVARGEGWLDEKDATLVAALSAIQHELSATALATRGVILDKTGRVSGLQVYPDGAGSMTITNYYRRRCYVYVDRVSYKDKTTGASVSFQGPILPQPIKIPAVKGVSNTLANLGAFLGGQRDFYEPVVSDPIGIPVNPPDAASTTYTATALGIGTNPGDFSNLTQVQEDGWWEVTVQSILYDIVAPIICGVILPSLNQDINDFAAFAGAGGVLKDILNAIAASPGIRANAKAGKLGDAAWDTLLLIVKTDTLKNVFLQVVFDFLKGRFNNQSPLGFAGNLLAADRAKLLAKSGEKLTKFIGKINVGLQVFDTVVTAFQLAYCNNADIFTLEVTNAIAKLNPDKATAHTNLTPIAFTASVTNADLASDALLVYQWSCPCKFGDISDGNKTNATAGNTFFSSSKVLSYVPNGKGKKGDIETVTVQIYKGPFNKKVAIGTASSQISFTADAGKSIPTTTQIIRLGFDYGVQAELFFGFATWKLQPGATLYTLRIHNNVFGLDDIVYTIPASDFAKEPPVLQSNVGYPPIATVPLVPGGIDISYYSTSQDADNGSGGYFNMGNGVVGFVGAQNTIRDNVAYAQSQFTYTVTVT